MRAANAYWTTANSAGMGLSVAVMGMFSGSAGLWPLDLKDIRDARGWDVLMTRARRLVLLGIFLAFAGPWVLRAGMCLDESGVYAGACAVLRRETGALSFATGVNLATGWVAGWLGMFLWQRYVGTWISHWRRDFRQRVANEKLSDIRDVAGKVRAVEFDPSKHYDPKGTKLFVGRDESGGAVYVEAEKFRKTHMEVIGPTGSGKGVAVGVLLDQAIRWNAVRGSKKHVVIAIMPKQDLWLPHVMERAARESGCRFVFFDMSTRARGGGWAPFASGNEEMRRTRIMSLLGMQATGGLDDFYKLGEKALIDQVLAHGPVSLPGLRKALKRPKTDSEGRVLRDQPKAVRAIDTLGDIARFDTFTVPHTEAGLKIEDILRSPEPTVVYVNSSMTNEQIKQMTSLMVMEITQVGMWLRSELDARTTHVTLFVDELRELVSDEFDKALATVSMFDINIISAYQSPSDVEKLRDMRLNAKAIADSIHTNSQLKLLYRIGEERGAQWAAGLTGKQYKNVSVREEVDVGNFAAERWGDRYFIEKKEEYFYTPNLFQSLRPRVGVLIDPGERARLLFTSPVRVERRLDFFRVSEAKAEEAPESAAMETELEPEETYSGDIESGGLRKKAKRRAMESAELLVRRMEPGEKLEALTEEHTENSDEGRDGERDGTADKAGRNIPASKSGRKVPPRAYSGPSIKRLVPKSAELQDRGRVGGMGERLKSAASTAVARKGTESVAVRKGSGSPELGGEARKALEKEKEKTQLAQNEKLTETAQLETGEGFEHAEGTGAEQPTDEPAAARRPETMSDPAGLP